MAKIKSIKRLQIKDEELYNLAVETDESFVANGVVVHNCKSSIVTIKQLKGNQKIEPLIPSTKALRDIDLL